MFDLNTLDDLSRLAETAELECKLAQGQDGKGEVPKDFWPTYSAMANAHGGVVLLGVREKAGRFSIAGLENPAKLRADLFNTLNNRAKVSVNLLRDADVEEVRIEGRSILVVRIPAATRQQRPVFLNGQPLGHTWRRLNEGDRLCDEATVKRLLAEQLEDSRDTRILDKFGLDDLDLNSLHAYRNAFAVHRPGHPWVTLDDPAFLHRVGGWREDRASGLAGLTAAGLLMFGRWPAIPEAFPLYFVDYQEQTGDPDSPTRWLDRVVPDGSWSGNLYDFFRRVIGKLTADLKVPFALKDGVRIDDTPAHPGLPKIRSGWEREGHSLRLHDSFEPFDQTVLEMTWNASSLAVSSEVTDTGSPISSPISSSKTEDRILQMLRDDPKYSAQQLGDALEISKRAVLKQIEKLKQQGRLSRIGSAKGGHWEVQK